MRRTPRRTRMLLAVAVLAAGVGVAAYATHLLRRSELQTIDARFSIRGSRRPPPNVVLVTVDNRTLDELAHAGRPRFPYPRRYDARLRTYSSGRAAVSKLAKEAGSKSAARKGLWVRIPPAALTPRLLDDPNSAKDRARAGR